MQRLLLILLFIVLIFSPFHPSPVHACQDGCDPANCSKHQNEANQEQRSMTASQASTVEDCDPADCPGHQEALKNKENTSASSEEMALDPVCGMKISKEASAAQLEYKGKTYYFCMPGEKETFLKDPQKYLGHP
jgi:YHS domain-containing protein